MLEHSLLMLPLPNSKHFQKHSQNLSYHYVCCYILLHSTQLIILMRTRSFTLRIHTHTLSSSSMHEMIATATCSLICGIEKLPSFQKNHISSKICECSNQFSKKSAVTTFGLFSNTTFLRKYVSIVTNLVKSLL